MNNQLTTVQENVKAVLEGMLEENKSYKGYSIKNVSRYQLCSKCGLETKSYSGRSEGATTPDEAIAMVGQLETELKVDEVFIDEDMDNNDFIVIELLGHSVIDGCRKCNLNITKEDVKMNINKMKKAELIELLNEVMAENERLKAEIASLTELQNKPGESAMKPVVENNNNKGDGNVKRQPKYTEEELQAMREAAMAGSKVVVAQDSTAKGLLDVDGDVVKSLMIVINKKDGKWISTNQAKYMSHRGVKAKEDSGDHRFVLKLTDGSRYLCDLSGVIKGLDKDDNAIYPFTKKETVGIEYPNKAFTMQDGRKVGVIGKESHGLRIGEFVFMDGTRIEYAWNPSKYKEASVKNAGKDTPVLKALLVAYYNLVKEAGVSAPVSNTKKEDAKIEEPIIE